MDFEIGKWVVKWVFKLEFILAIGDPTKEESAFHTSHDAK